MKKILIIGTGNAGSVTAKKCDQHKDTFSEIILANRTYQKAENLQRQLTSPSKSYQLDADHTHEIISLLEKEKPFLVINMALPYQDLSIMQACLETNTHYIDTANYEPKDEAKFCYQWQWDFHEKFKKRNLMALLGCGFDPGVTNVFCAYAQKEYFDEIHHIDIIDCNDGSHDQPFATNFNPEINIREITQKGKYYKNKEWIETPPLSESKTIDFPEVGPRTGYLMYHEELESLVKHIPNIKSAKFWMTFSESYLTHLKVLQNVGLTSIKPTQFNNQPIVPLQFLKHMLPKPESLAQNYAGKTSIGCILKGIKNNQEKTITIYNCCDHQKTFEECGAQAVAYTTGVPAMIGAKLMIEETWLKAGVFNVEQLNPTPFMDELNQNGLNWNIHEQD